jgi:hypothetical protein
MIEINEAEATGNSLSSLAEEIEHELAGAYLADSLRYERGEVAQTYGVTESYYRSSSSARCGTEIGLHAPEGTVAMIFDVDGESSGAVPVNFTTVVQVIVSVNRDARRPGRCSAKADDRSGRRHCARRRAGRCLYRDVTGRDPSGNPAEIYAESTVNDAAFLPLNFTEDA